jgi:hypothetical protein
MDKDILKEAKEAFKEAEEAENEMRKAALDDVKFGRLGDQWPDHVKNDREAEKRPCLTINKMPAFIRQVVNDARLNKPTIKTHPVDDSADIETSRILNGLIRNIEVTSDADNAYIGALDSAVSSSFGYFRVSLDYAHDDSFDMDIRIDRVANQFSVYGDPNSTTLDGSDWNKAFVTELVPVKKFKEEYGEVQANFEDGEISDWRTDESIRKAEYWKREEIDRTIVMLNDSSIWDREEYLKRKDVFDVIGISVVNERKTKSYKVTQYIMTGEEVLETNPWPGLYIPIIPVYGEEINVEGKRHFLSLVRSAKDPQRMFNYWRTAATELVALAPKTPFIGPKGAFVTDADKWETANTKSHPYIEFDGNIPPQRQPFAGVPAGAIQEALNASDDMKSIIGIYDASLGARSNETSGRAILARQREGDVSTFHFIDNLNHSMRHAGRILVDLIPKVYDKPRIVRILGPDNEPENVQINSSIIDEDGKERIFDLSAGKYDVTIETGPSFTTQRQEAAEQMLEFMRVYPNAGPLMGDLLAKNMDWPGAEELSERLKAMLPPQLNKEQQQVPPQIQQQIGQMQEAIDILKQQLGKANSDLMAAKGEMASAATEARKAQIDLEMKQIDERMKKLDASVKIAEIRIKEFELAGKQREMMMSAMEKQEEQIEEPEQGLEDQQENNQGE